MWSSVNHLMTLLVWNCLPLTPTFWRVKDFIGHGTGSRVGFCFIVLLCSLILIGWEGDMDPERGMGVHVPVGIELSTLDTLEVLNWTNLHNLEIYSSLYFALSILFFFPFLYLVTMQKVLLKLAIAYTVTEVW